LNTGINLLTDPFSFYPTITTVSWFYKNAKSKKLYYLAQICKNQLSILLIIELIDFACCS